MLRETEDKLEKIRRVSRVLRRVCQALLVLTALLFVVASIGVLAGRDVTLSFFDIRIPVAPLALPARLILVAILGLSIGVVAKGLYHLDRLLSNYARGEIFTAGSAGQIRQLGITAILWAGVSILWPIAAIGFTEPRPTSFPLHLDWVFTGVVIIVISWFMDAAAEMREEADLTI